MINFFFSFDPIRMKNVCIIEKLLRHDNSCGRIEAIYFVRSNSFCSITISLNFFRSHIVYDKLSQFFRIARTKCRPVLCILLLLSVTMTSSNWVDREITRGTKTIYIYLQLCQF